MLQGRFLTAVGWMATLAKVIEAELLAQTPNHFSCVAFLPSGSASSMWAMEKFDEKELHV